MNREILIKYKPRSYTSQLTIVIIPILFLLNFGDFSRINLTIVISIIAIILFLAEFLRMIIKPIYIKEEEDQLVIYKSYFRKNSIDKSNIIKIENDYNPLPIYYIYLKSGKKVSFSESIVKDSEFNELKSLLGL